MANTSQYLRISELIADEKWSEAANQIAAVVENSGSKLLLDPAGNSNNCRVFLPSVQFANAELCRWAATAPKALKLYRDLVDAESKATLKRAIESEDVSQLEKVADFFFTSRSGDEAVNRLAHVYFEQGHFSMAETKWNSLITTKDFPADSILKYPDSNLPQFNLMCNSMAASLLARDFDSANAKLRYLENLPPETRFQFLGKSDLTIDALNSVFVKEKELLQATSRKIRQQNVTRPIDPQGKSIWRMALERQEKSNSPFWNRAPPVAEGSNFAISVFPELDNQTTYWCDTHHIFRHDLGKGPATKIWSTLFPRETFKPSRKLIGRPVFDLEIVEQKLFARMGDPRTSYRNDSVTRNRSYLIGLDLSKDGTVLSGFPMSNKDPRTEFDATPRYIEGRLFVVKRKTFRDNSVGKIVIQCLSLSPSFRANKPEVLWENNLISGESSNKGVWDETTKTELVVVENNIAFIGMGFVLLLDLETGKLRWTADYYRDRVVFPGQVDPINKRPIRALDRALYNKGKLIVAPADSDCTLCFDIKTGRCLWKSRSRDSAHLVAVTSDNVIISGHQLMWLDLATGRTVFQFPPNQSNKQPGYRLNQVKGIGKGYLANGILYWPTANRIFAFDTKLNRQGIPDLLKTIDLVPRQVTGGNLHIENGIMLIANEKELVAFRE